VLDEIDCMVLDPDLRRLIMQIEDFYNRRY
jgi:hypothetical protein